MTIRDLLNTAGVTQNELARRLGIQKAAMSKKLSGQRGWDPIEVLVLWDVLKRGRGRAGSLDTLCRMCGSRTDLL